MSFWNTLPTPFLVLAPMEDVTDTVFRRMVAGMGKPDVFFTEFTSTDGFMSEGMEKVAQRLVFSKDEHPIVAQIWGDKPENFFAMSQKIAEMGFDGIDINFGCPQRNILKCGGGGAMIGNLSLAGEIITATREGGKLPVSVKTRIGKKKIDTEEWIGGLLEYNLDALIVHGRTVSEQSKVPAHWDEIGKVVHIRDSKGINTKIIGNGDVKSRMEAMERVRETGVDGVMIGRGIFENPAVFSPSGTQLSIEERFRALYHHIQLFEEVWQGKKHFQILKKFVKTYISGFDGAAAIRAKLMGATSLEELRKMTGEFIDGTYTPGSYTG